MSIDIVAGNTSGPNPNPVVSLTKREAAELSIRNAIETGQYKPGQVISQRQIVEDLGLSVTPIREAILVLSSNGIVERHKHHSIKVSEIDADRLRQIFEVRHMLEERAVREAAVKRGGMVPGQLRSLNGALEPFARAPVPAEINRLDRAFHTLIFSSCGNDALVWAIDQVKSSFPMYALWNEPGRVETSVAEHWALVEAIDAQDPDAAALAQKRHLANGLEATIAYLEKLLS